MPDRLIPRSVPAGGIARRLFELAHAVRRLPPRDRRDPERLHVAKSDVATALRRVTNTTKCASSSLARPPRISSGVSAEESRR
jgi:hypothetical protein